MPLTTGTRLGPYLIEALLGAGGMGEVYKARDTRLNRDVAVKVLAASLANDEDRLRRFTLEAQAAGALNHPNILAVFDVGTDGGMPYVVSELLDGETLRARLDRGRLPISKAVEYARQVAAGLSAAHEKGITHRDIKPENLFVTTDGRVKILDFGLAKQRATDVSDATTLHAATSAGVILGTVGYMSPEQVRGRPADARSDIFSFGCALHEMLSGVRAFSGASAVETMHAILETDPPELPPAVLQGSPGLVRIVRRCLEKDPAERFHSAHDLGLAIESVSGLSESGGSAVAPSIVPAGRVTLLRIGTWAAIAIVAGAAGALVARRLASTPAAEPTRVDYLTYSGHDASPAASPDGKTIAFMSDRDGVRRIWHKQVDGGGELALTSGPDDYPRFSPDGSMLLFVRTTGGSSALYRVPLLGGDPRKLLDNVAGGDWSPDGRQIVFTRWLTGDRSGSTVGVVDAEGSNEREVLFIAGAGLAGPRWSPDGQTLAAVNRLSSAPDLIQLVDVSGTNARVVRMRSKVSSVAWTSDSRHLIYSLSESIVARAADSSAMIVRQDVATGAVQVLAWVPTSANTLDILGSGRVLLDGGSPRVNLREWSNDRGESSARWLTRGNSTDRQPTYSPDGTWVAFSSNRGGSIDLWAVHRTTGAVKRLTDHPAIDWDVAYSPDGLRLLWCSTRTGTSEVWAANPDGSASRQLTQVGVAANPQQSPDGQWIVFISVKAETAGVWRMRSDGSKPVHLVDKAVGVPEISPDGRYVSYFDSLTSRIRVIGLHDGAPVPFEIQIERGKHTNAILGRSRWMPDGRSIAFLGQDERGVNGIFVQDFVPGRDTAATRRKLGGFDAEHSVETFGISGDGKYVTVGGWEQMFNILIASHVPGIGERPRKP